MELLSSYKQVIHKMCEQTDKLLKNHFPYFTDTYIILFNFILNLC